MAYSTYGEVRSPHALPSPSFRHATRYGSPPNYAGYSARQQSYHTSLSSPASKDPHNTSTSTPVGAWLFVAVVVSLCVWSVFGGYRAAVRSLDRGKGAWWWQALWLAGSYVVADQISMPVPSFIQAAIGVRAYQATSLLAVLAGVFWYRASLLASVLLTGAAATTAFVLRWPEGAAYLRKAVSAGVASFFSRTSWWFYRDLFALILTHSGNNRALAYLACTATFWGQCLLALSASTVAALLVRQIFFSSPPLAGPPAAALSNLLSSSLPHNAVTASAVLAFVSAYALQNNFPGPKGFWFW